MRQAMVGESEAMTIDEFIAALESLRDAHGGMLT